MVADAVGARRFRRINDGVLGLGYYIDWAGLRQASVAWPDGPSVRYVPDDFDRGIIEDVGPAFPVSVAADHECKIELVDGKYVCGSVVIHQACGEECKLGERVESPSLEVDSKRESFDPTDLTVEEMQSRGMTIGKLPDFINPESVELKPQVDPESERLLATNAITEYLTRNPEAPIPQVVEHLATIDVRVTPEQVAGVRERLTLSVEQ